MRISVRKQDRFFNNSSSEDCLGLKREYCYKVAGIRYSLLEHTSEWSINSFIMAGRFKAKSDKFNAKCLIAFPLNRISMRTKISLP